MANLSEKSLDELADLILQIRWQNLLEVWSAIREKMENKGIEAVQSAFSNARQRILNGALEDYQEVRWGINLCPHCNDNNVEKNGIAYMDSSGDGIEFNQCLNCRIGILYDLEMAKGEMDSYVIGVGKAAQFNGLSFFWVAIPATELRDRSPMYEILEEGQWIGTLSVDADRHLQFLPFEKMADNVSRGAGEVWSSEISDKIEAAFDEFTSIADDQLEVALVL
ncbi:MAG: hypothetical protein R6V83_04550 [Candidatus Thorarchaeota archaeon]